MTDLSRFVLDCRLWDATGIGRYIRGLSQQLKGNGVCLLIRGEAAASRRGLNEIVTTLAPFSLREQCGLPRLLHAQGATLFHACHFNVPLGFRGVLVTTVHDCALDKYPEECASVSARAYYKIMFSRALRKSHALIAVSESTKEDLIQMRNVPRDVIHVIHHGINPAAYRARMGKPDVQHALRSRLQIDSSYGLYVGLTRPRKNLRTLLSAVRILKDRGRPMQIVLAGRIDRRYLDVGDEVQRLNIEPFVRQAGWVTDDELVTLYEGARFLVFPSLYEGFGFPPLEAMICGIPVVASDIPATREIAGPAALYFDPRNPEEMADCIERVNRDNSLRAQLIETGLKQAASFSWEECAQKTLSLYKSAFSEACCVSSR